ncbi:MAG TPA: TlpA disulfide reductase family protein [Nannocystaceae bacterium]|nr:TlpA disulfide reductase family protein [Nannocystaceae bacterium]
MVALVLALVVSACAGARSNARGPATRIAGHIHGHDGRVPSLAHARVIDPGTMQPLAQVEAGKDGAFELKARHRGLAWLELSAVDHAVLQVPIMLDGEPIGIAATMGTYAAGAPEAVVQLYAWDGDPMKREPQVVDMTRAADGTLSGDIASKASKLRVQVTNLGPIGRGFNPPGADDYEYDGGGDYRGIYKTKGGKLHIAITPDARTAGLAPKLVVTPSDSASAKVAALGDVWQPSRAVTLEDAPKLWARARASDDTLTKRLALAMALSSDVRRDPDLPAEDRELAKWLIASTPFGDSLWAMMPFGLARAADLSGDPTHLQLVDRVVQEQLGPQLSGIVLMQRLAAAYETGNDARAKQLYDRLQQPPWSELGMAEAADAWKPGRKIVRGGKLPSFELTALGGAGKVSSDALRGKLVLVELWASWCQPCLEGMDELHALHREYADAGFEILAISMDEGEAEVVDLRRRWPMPWTHAFAGEARERIYSTFETSSLPYSVLVDGNGTILEESAAPVPGKLRGWLEKHAPR